MLILREPTVEDRLAVARVHVRSWQIGYQGLMPSDYLEQLRPEDRAAHYTFGEPTSVSSHWTVALEKDRLIGFVNSGRCRDSDTQDHGEIFALYVDPDFWRQGVGRALMESAQANFRQMGWHTANLWVLEGNMRAIDFYEREGWSRDGEGRTEEVWGLEVSSIRFQRSF